VNETAVVVREVSKRFGRRVVLDGVSLAVRAGESVALVGENGAGKSTLLRVCAGIIEPDGGTVETSGGVGYCPQEPGVLELLTADDHLVLVGRAFGRNRRQAIDDGRALLHELGFTADPRQAARTLSGGARQKLNLALAVLGERRVLLLDEPYQGFDHGSYVNFWDHVGAWCREGRAVIVVTHMLAELDRVDRVVELSAPMPAPLPAA